MKREREAETVLSCVRAKSQNYRLMSSEIYLYIRTEINGHLYDFFRNSCKILKLPVICSMYYCYL